MIDQSSGFRERGGGWVVTQSLLMALVVTLGLVTRGAWSSLDGVLVGALLFVTGAYFGITGVRALGSNRTPYPKPREGSVLVRGGVYSRVRHPLYASVILMSIGWALLWRSGLSLAAASALVPFFYAKARREERWLRERYPAYADYSTRVPRFIPRLKPIAKCFL